jgi:ribosomal protein S18 acetylase RimI-like enzyme
MQNSPTTRIASLKDVTTLLEFEQSLIAAERPHALTLNEGPIHYYDLKYFIEDDNTHLLLVEMDDIAIGCGYVQIRNSPAHHNSTQHAYMGFMYVQPEWRGQGLNRLIMHELQSWSVARGVRHFRLDVFMTNQAAVRAYEKIGFQANMIEMVMEL